MAAGDLLHQRAGSGAEAVRRMVAVFAPTTALADLVVRSQGGIALREPLGVVAGQHHAPLGLFGVVAGHAVPVPNRLNVAWVVEYIGHAGHGCNLAWRTSQRHQAGVVWAVIGGSRARFVTAHASLGLAGYDHREVLHPLDRHAAFVERDEIDRAQSRNFERSRPVGLDRNGPQDPAQRDVSAVITGQSVFAARLGQVFQHQQLLDRARLDPGHVAATVDVGQHQLSRGLLQIGTSGKHPFAKPWPDHPWIVNHLLGPIEFLGLAGVVQNQKALVARHQETVRGQRVGIAKSLASLPRADTPPQTRRLGADLPGGGPLARSGFDIDQHHVSGILATPEGRRKDAHDLAGRAGDRQRITLGEKRRVRPPHAAKQDHLSGPVGVHHPQVAELLRVAVRVIPPRVDDASVRQNRRTVFRNRVGRQTPDAAAIRVHPVDDGRRHAIAGHKTVAAARCEDDAAVRQIGRIDVVAVPGGQLPKPGSIDVDLAQMVMMRAAWTIGEEDLPAIVMDTRIAESALGIVQQHSHLPRPQVELTELRPVGGMDELRFVGIFAKGRVPLVGRRQITDDEHDLFRAAHRPQGLVHERACPD